MIILSMFMFTDSDIDVANALVSLKGLNSSNSRHQLIGKTSVFLLLACIYLFLFHIYYP